MYKTKISIVRGAFLNPFELQNYYLLARKYEIQAVSSINPINQSIKLPLTKLPSPTDIPSFPYKYQILNRLFIDAHYLVGLEKAIHGSDLVHVAETYFHYTHQAIKAKLRGRVKKIISTVWEVIPHNNEGIRGRRSFKKLAHKHIDHFLAVTKLAKQTLIEEGVTKNKITVIPMGVDIKKFSPIKKDKNKKNVQILYIGRLVPEKGIEELKEAFRELKKTNKNIKLNLVSSVPYSKIHKIYQKADIFCLPSKPTKYWQEQFGMVLVEAMASGLPIVATKTGAIPEVCGNVALYAAPGNSKGLEKQLTKLVDDPTLRSRLGYLARKRALKLYDHRKVAKQIDKLYQKVLNS